MAVATQQPVTDIDTTTMYAAEDSCPIEAPPGLKAAPRSPSKEALAAAIESGTFRAPPGLAAPPGLELIRHSPPPGFATLAVMKRDDDNTSEKSTDAEGSGEESVPSPVVSKLNLDAPEFVPSSAKPKQTLNLTHAIMVPEEDNEDNYYKKESSKYPGRLYWVHKKTGATTWKCPGKKEETKKPKEAAKPKKEVEITAEALSAEISKTLSQLSNKACGEKSFDDTDGCSTDAGAEQTGESDFDSEFSRSACSKSVLPSLGKLVM